MADLYKYRSQDLSLRDETTKLFRVAYGTVKSKSNNSRWPFPNSLSLQRDIDADGKTLFPTMTR